MGKNTDQKGKNNPNWRGGKKKYTCLRCGKLFYSYTESKYCSCECYYEVKKLGNILKQCLTCGKEFETSKVGGRVYCDKVCLKNDKEGCRTRAIKASKASHKKQKENVEDWKTCRERALEHYALTCMRCGNNFPRKKLVVHHRDGKNICSELADHSLKNLMVLCRKCHNQLHKELRSVIGKFVGLSNVEKGMHYMLRGLKEEYGLKIEDQHFKDTPKRVARSFAEIFEGVKDTEKQIEKILSTAFTSDMDQMIVIKDMHVFSMCPHHFLPVEMYVDVAYIPSGFVLGLSKIPRLVEVLAKRPVIQEQVTEEITKYLMDIKALGAAARIRGQHFCMRMRGVKKPESIAITTSVTGAFKDDLSTRQEFLTYLQDSKTF